MLKKLLSGMVNQRQQDRKAELYRNFIRHEAKIGGRLFGPVPTNHRREFFCLDEHTWVWHEEWKDKAGQSHVQTTRYDVRPNGILKSQGNRYQKVEGREALRLYEAAKLYQQRIRSEIYTFAQ